MRTTILLSLLSILFVGLQAQSKNDFSDGPYIFEKKDSLKILWVNKGIKMDTVLAKANVLKFEEKNLPVVNLNQLNFNQEAKYQFEGVEKFTALSDIHGQYDLFVELLHKQNIIDENNNWAYGNGHLVIVGDVFDRGPKVTECLWLLFRLEKEALKAGGKVHFILGNHELMILHNDVRYIHKKYRYSSGVHGIEYPELYGENSVLGQWLRSKAVYISINGIGFVHGGFSKKVIEKESDIKTINQYFLNSLVHQAPIEKDSNSILSLLYFDNGPLWYREYANPDGFDLDQLAYILQQLQLEAIVVGHTSMPRIISRANNKIFLIDSSMKFGTSGELLVYQDSLFFRGLLDGSRILIESNYDGIGKSTFQYVYELEDEDLTIKIDTDLKELFNSNTEGYQKAKLVAIHNDEENRVWNIRIKKRGEMRKKVCKLPPLKIDFSKETLSELGFDKNDKMKLVLPCDNTKDLAQGLFREEIIYRLYQIIDPLGFRTRLINIDLLDNGKSKYQMKAFFIEDEENFALRSGAKLVETGVIQSAALDREHYLKMVLFQYMIRNTDWSIPNRHNVEIISSETMRRVCAVPYDFDYAGIVGQDYAVPHESIAIENVRVPYFMEKNIKREELVVMKQFYNIHKTNFESTIKESKYLNKSSKKMMLNYIKEFYQKLNNEKKWGNYFLK